MTEKRKWSEDEISRLRADVKTRMSEKRYLHTLAVEDMAVRLSELFCPEKKDTLRVAALLHDITKEKTLDEQTELCRRYSIPVTEMDLLSPKTFHAKTAAAIIPDEYPNFADEEVISCVRWHTTGRAGMTLPEKLIYLADYIDMSRTFEDCVRLRELFMSAQPEKMNDRERTAHLRDILITSYDMTISCLVSDGLPISRDTVEARNELVREQIADRR